MNKVILKKGREKALLRGHPWVFSGAVDALPQVGPGTILPIYSSDGQFLAQGYFNPGNSLVGRILSFEEGGIKELLKKNIVEAISMRKELFGAGTNAYRLINGEGDGIPGLIVDFYNGYLALQIHTRGIENLKPFFVEQLIELIKPKGIYEKSHSPARQEEGLESFEGLLYGEVPETIEILENGVKFVVSLPNGQKTGFFLDQRSMRAQVGKLAKGRKVLNCFAYSGGFSIYALEGGAQSVTSVDSCSNACKLAKENSLLNNFENHVVVQSDVFEFLERETFDWDLVILDPPAFAKKKANLEHALKGYQKLNEKVMRKLPPRSLLLTCSCSHFVDENLFQLAIFTASRKAGRFVRIIGKHAQAPDHPIAITHPEGSYLKSLLLFVQ
ncbi:MAG: class I SAM-dependent rRNA methyltransferase [Verrucomicrobia bacterium]|nr:class I SAM-dependent rRNA methyltransferase [Verrucomicrobiota bacterium]